MKVSSQINLKLRGGSFRLKGDKLHMKYLTGYSRYEIFFYITLNPEYQDPWNHHKKYYILSSLQDFDGYVLS
jgi:hypothetical protein